jgi:hypothetical protein
MKSFIAIRWNVWKDMTWDVRILEKVHASALALAVLNTEFRGR